MPRSYDSRQHPSGPFTEPARQRALRGLKRIGPIRGIIPGDDVEVAREIARLWQALQGPHRGGGSGSDCCPPPNVGGPMEWVDGNIISIYTQHDSLVGWWRLGESGPAAANYEFKNSADAALPLVMAVVGTATSLSFNGPGPNKLGLSDDGAFARLTGTEGANNAQIVKANAAFQFDNVEPFTMSCWFAGGTDPAYLGGDCILDENDPGVGAERVLFGVREDLSPQKGNAFMWDAYTMTLSFLRKTAASEVRVTCPFPFALDQYDGDFWADWDIGAFTTPSCRMANWHHAAVTFDGTQLKMYLDGIRVKTVATVLSMGAGSAGGVHLGGGTHGVGETQRSFIGAIDEAAIWSAALTAAQVAEIYHAGGDPSSQGSWREWEVGTGDLSEDFWEKAEVPRRRVFEDVLALGGAKTLAVPLVASLILCDATAGSFTVTLPAVADSEGARLLFKKTNAANTVTIDGSGAETIDGAATAALSTQYSTLLIYCDGTTWRVQGAGVGSGVTDHGALTGLADDDHTQYRLESVALVNADIAAAAAIAVSKLAAGAEGQVVKTTGGAVVWGAGGSGIAETLLDAKGDLIVGSAADTAAREPVGADGEVLVAEAAQANGVDWQKIVDANVDAAAAIAVTKLGTVLGAKAGMNANQAVVTATWTSLVLDGAEAFDTDTMHDPATNPSRITVKTAGLYLIISSVNIDAVAAGNRYTRIWKNGAASLSDTAEAGTAAVQRIIPNIFPAILAVNDYVEVQHYQDSGANLTVFAGTGTYLTLIRLGT